MNKRIILFIAILAIIVLFFSILILKTEMAKKVSTISSQSIVERKDKVRRNEKPSPKGKYDVFKPKPQEEERMKGQIEFSINSEENVDI
jgi:hypothetical protein